MNTKFSIITVAYNNLAGLKRTSKSVLSQTATDFEWLVFDGGSTDGSKEFLIDISDKLSYHESVPDRGIYNAMNKGVRKAKGEYLLFLNAGDVFASDDVIEHALKLDFENSGVVYGDWYTINGTKRRRVSAPIRADFDYFCHSNICHQAMFIRTDILKASEYDETIGPCADWAKWLELSGAGITFRYIPLTICVYEMGGISNGIDYAEHLVQVFESMPPEFLPRIHMALVRKILNTKTLAGYLGYESAKCLKGLNRIKYTICKKLCKALKKETSY